MYACDREDKHNCMDCVVCENIKCEHHILFLDYFNNLKMICALKIYEC